MIHYTGFQWLLIDAANQWGNDKMRFEDRIEWAEAHLADLEAIVDQAETKPLYIKAVQAIRKAQAGLPTGHLVGADGVCSGIQIMSVVTGCEAGARATGLIDPDRRPDAYTDVTQAMNNVLGGSLNVSRADAKDAVMHSFYGSKKTPKDTFGEDTEELAAFYTASQQVAPGAWGLLQELLSSWQPWALVHAWKLPDGFDARVKVMQPVVDKQGNPPRIEIDELDHATFTYELFENKGSRTGLSLAANVTHSLDGYVLRSVHRRCNYDADMLYAAVELVQQEQGRRLIEGVAEDDMVHGTKLDYYVGNWARSGMPDVVILPYLTEQTVRMVPTELLEELEDIMQTMMDYKPFEVVSVHDEFKCHANNVNHMRQQYAYVLADLAESEVLSDILSQIHGKPGNYPKLSNNLAAKIRRSNYALS